MERYTCSVFPFPSFFFCLILILFFLFALKDRTQLDDANAAAELAKRVVAEQVHTFANIQIIFNCVVFVLTHRHLFLAKRR